MLLLMVKDNDKGPPGYLSTSQIVHFKYHPQFNTTKVHCSDNCNYHFRGDITRQLLANWPREPGEPDFERDNPLEVILDSGQQKQPVP